MKKASAWLLVIAMTAALAVGGTLAYLTDTDEDVNVMTVGKVKIDQLEYERVEVESKDEDATVQEFHNNKPLYPAVTEDGFDWTAGDTYVDWEQIGKDGYTSDIWDPTKINNEQDKMVFVKNKGDFDAYVRTVFAFEAGNYETLDEYLADVHFNLNEEDWTWEWSEPPVEIGGGKYFIATATYNKVLEPGALTEISLSQIALDPSVTNEDVAGFGDTFQVLVQSQAVQADGFADADTALTEAFGELITDKTGDEKPPFEVIPEDVPFEDDNPIKGSGLYNALHYLESDPNGTDITAKVNTVTFGLNEDYPKIVENEKGYLLDEEQDTDAYTYYVENDNGGYDIYVLTDDVVHAPKDSSNLFYNMTALTTINSEYLDTSRAENFTFLMRNCTALTAINGIENWDTSSVVDFTGTFRDADAIETLDLSGWEVDSAEKLYASIYACDNLKTLNISGWNIASPCDARWLAAGNPKLEQVIATGSSVDGITKSTAMFQNNSAMHTLVGEEGWVFANNTDAGWMFENCSSLTDAEVGTWGFENLKVGSGLFSGCAKLQSVNGSGNWNLSNVVYMDNAFQNNSALTYVDATNWDLSNCIAFNRTFLSCGALTAVEGTENWNTGNVETFYAAFYYNRKLADIDVSTWDTSSVTNMGHMFNRCVSLEVLDIANWDVSNVTDFSYFLKGTGNTGDIKIKVLDVSKWNPVNATSFMCTFYGCAQITEMDMSGWVMPNLESVSHMFADCYKLEKVDFTGWETPKLNTVDALFNNCESLKTVDVSSLDTANVVEFSQVFEYCYSLEEIIGLDKWDTTSAQDFGEMFSHCNSLKELDLSSFNSTNARDSYVNPSNGDGNDRFNYFLSGCNSLEKITFGEKFSFDGDGSFTKWTFVMPSATNVAGWDGYWYNAETGVAYLPSEIPEETAATYVAVKPSANP